ncbi:hypothetical protein MNBD_ACTINO02-3247 [hydrothermal vent metagenome]|uniref:Ferric uptake regulation protein FUR n=1 Tax=hydrothermal vent metagenome TaxID=652676 RepID=A0A3B0SJZ1_9ZZZZ
MQATTLTELHARVKKHLSENDVRYSTGRQKFIAALHAAGGPRSATHLHTTELDDVPLSSLYRTLTVLETVGVLERTHDGDGVAMFELGEWLLGHHHHLICTSCDIVTDIDLGDDLENAVAEISATVAASHGFTMTGHTLDVLGLCEDCG